MGIDSGSGASAFDAFTLSNNVNYFAAATVDVTASSPTAITLYLQDLSTSTLQVANFNRDGGSSGTVTTIVNAAAPFSIGATAQGSAFFTGAIDEVRLSNVKLAEADLLISAIPEPSMAGLVMAGATALLLLRRRQR